MIKVLVILMLLLSPIAHADDKELADFWYYTSQGIIVADWLTTRNAADRYEENYYENNPVVALLIEKDGRIDKERLDILSIITLFGNHAIQSYMSTDQRITFNSWHALIRFKVVAHNMKIGLRIEIPL